MHLLYVKSHVFDELNRLPFESGLHLNWSIFEKITKSAHRLNTRKNFEKNDEVPNIGFVQENFKFESDGCRISILAYVYGIVVKFNYSIPKDALDRTKSTLIQPSDTSSPFRKKDLRIYRTRDT